MALEYFPCYHSYRKKLVKLSDQEVGRLFRALLEYSELGETKELTGRESVAFDFIADDIDRAKSAYEEKCETNRKNGRKGANAIERPQTPANAPKTKTKSETKNETKNESKSNTPTSSEVGDNRARFSPPAVADVLAYCRERKNKIDPQHFVDYYQARGWRLGNGVMMEDWRAALRAWERKEAEYGTAENRDPEMASGTAKKWNVQSEKLD